MAILNFGSLNIDMTYAVEQIVKPGQTIPSKSLSVSCGGKGFNQSIALVKAGAKVFHAGKIGFDGKVLIDKLRECNVDTTAISDCSLPCGRALIQVDQKGENSIILYGGSNLAITKKEIDHVFSKIRNCEWLLIQNEINNIPAIIKTAKKFGMKIAFNLAPFKPDSLTYPLEYIDILIVNETEGAALTGLDDPMSAIKKLSEKFPLSIIVLTLGKSGLILSYDKKIYKQPSYHVKTVDTTGAGDTFTGYFIQSIESGESPEFAADWASRASALCVSSAGSSNSIPCSKDVSNAVLKLRKSV